MLVESTTQTLARKLLRVALKPGDSSDRDLLIRFAVNRDEDAFAELVRRHGRMVLAVTRRVTGHPQDAEDAFQAAFLVLARRATQIKQPEQLANWLYGVAYRTALEARATRRRVLEHSVSALPEPSAPPSPDDASDLRRVIDEEMASLPDKYRATIVLCDLEGLPRAEAATKLKIPEGTLSSRLAYARKVLANRLTRRGITSSAGGVATLLVREATGSALPRELVLLTARAATQVTSGGAIPANLVSPSVSHLAEGVMKIMLANRLRLSMTTGIFACGLLALGALGLAQSPTQNPAHPAADVRQSPNSPNDPTRDSANPHSRANTVIARGIEDDDVPYESLPSQAVVRIEQGKLIIRRRVSTYTPITYQTDSRAVHTTYQPRSTVAGMTSADIADVIVFDMKGNRLMPKTWKEKLKVDAHVLLAFDGKLPHPRELALFKDDTLILVLPGNFSTQQHVTPAPAPVPNPYTAVPGYQPNVWTYTPQPPNVPQPSFVPATNYVLPPDNTIPPQPATTNPGITLPPSATRIEEVSPSPTAPSTTPVTPPQFDLPSQSTERSALPTTPPDVSAQSPRPTPTQPVPASGVQPPTSQPAPTPAFPPATSQPVPTPGVQPAASQPIPTPTTTPQPSTPPAARNPAPQPTPASNAPLPSSRPAPQPAPPQSTPTPNPRPSAPQSTPAPTDPQPTVPQPQKPGDTGSSEYDLPPLEIPRTPG